jgi:hypothetical protein
MTSYIFMVIVAVYSRDVCRWEAQFVVMDSEPFYNITDILRSFTDDRLWLYANWVGFFNLLALSAAQLLDGTVRGG